jgi:subtilisin
MLHRRSLCLLVCGLVGAAMPLSTAVQHPIAAAGRYLVVLKDSASPSEIVRSLARLDASVDHLFGTVNTLVASLPSANLDALTDDPRVAYVASDRHLRVVLGTGSRSKAAVPTGVARIGAAPPSDADGSVGTTEPARAAVAILDTGIENRPDLNVVGRHDCLFRPADGGEGDETTTDRNGHGTHVAGIIAGAGGAGVIGVSPGTPLYDVRVMDADGMGDSSEVVCGLNWVAEHAAAKNIKVVNLSLGGPASDDGNCGRTDHDPIHTAVCRVTAAGVTVVAAAGNEGGDLAASAPAAYSEVLAVTAMADFDGQPGGVGFPLRGCRTSNADDTAADFSNYAIPGSPAAEHTIAAPGDCITSAWTGGRTKTLSGTSMASPHVAGLIARCLDAGPCSGLSPARIIAKLRSDAASRPPDTGFVGDSHDPIPDRSYGDLATVAGY